MNYAASIARRLAPDREQLQVVLGTLLGRGRLVAARDGVRLVLSLRGRHAWLAEWTYERLAPLVSQPARASDRVIVRSEPHPLFADLAERIAAPHALRDLIGTDALRLWALYQRLEDCESAALGAACRCELLRPPRPRVLAPAS